MNIANRTELINTIIGNPPLIINEIISYSKALIRMNRHRACILTADDLVDEAICQGANDFKSAKKIIQNYFLSELRRNKSSILDYKRCRYCNEVKPAGAFYYVQDKRVNYWYYTNRCKECFRQRYFSVIKKRRSENI